jgi:hypothetical protein
MLFMFAHDVARRLGLHHLMPTSTTTRAPPAASDPPAEPEHPPVLNAVGLSIAIIGIPLSLVVLIPGLVLLVTAAIGSATRGARWTSSARPSRRALVHAAGATRPAPARATAGLAARAVVGPAAHDVAHGQDPRRLALLDDDEVAEAAADHRDRRLLERPLRAREDEIAR